VIARRASSVTHTGVLAAWQLRWHHASLCTEVKRML
jgi:hypothetical protein